MLFNACENTATASGFPTFDGANLTQMLQQMLQQAKDYSNQLEQLEQLKNQYSQQMKDAAKPFTDTFNTANQIIGTGMKAYDYVNGLYGNFQDVNSYIKNSSGSWEEWQQCALNPSCNPMDKAFEALQRVGMLSEGASAVAAETANTLHTTITSSVFDQQNAALNSAQGERGVLQSMGQNAVAKAKSDATYQVAVLKNLEAINNEIAEQKKERVAINEHYQANYKKNKEKLDNTKATKLKSLVWND
jgi:hypothetical protein